LDIIIQSKIYTRENLDSYEKITKEIVA